MKRKLVGTSGHQAKRGKSESSVLKKIAGVLEKEGKTIFDQLKMELLKDSRLSGEAAIKRELSEVEPAPSSLHAAVLTEDINEIKDALQHTPIDFKPEKYLPALFWVCKIGNPELIKYFFAQGANFNQTYYSRNTASFAMMSNKIEALDTLFACTQGAVFSETEMEALAFKYIIPALEYRATDSLHWLFNKLVEQGNEDTVRRYAILLCALGIANFSNQLSADQLRALINETLDQIALIVNYLARFSCTGALKLYGYTPILWAVTADRGEACKTLLARNPELIGWRGPINETLAHLAADSDAAQIIRFFKASHPDLLAITDKYNRPPIEWAVSKDQLNACQALLAINPGSIHHRRVSGEGLAHMAALHKAKKIIKFFVASHPKLFSLQDHNGRLPILSLLAPYSADEFKTILALDEKTFLNYKSRDFQGNLAHYAAQDGNRHSLSVLNEKQPELFSEEVSENTLELGMVHKFTPLCFAILFGKFENVEWFGQNRKKDFEWKATRDSRFFNLWDLLPKTESTLNHIYFTIRALMKYYPEGLEEKDSKGLTPLQRTTNPIFATYFKLNNPQTLISEKMEDTYWPNFMGHIQKFLEVYLFMCCAPKHRINIPETVANIILGYHAQTDMELMLSDILSADASPGRSTHFATKCSIILAGISKIYLSKYIMFFGRNKLDREKLTTIGVNVPIEAGFSVNDSIKGEIVEAVEFHASTAGSSPESVAKWLINEWQQRSVPAAQMEVPVRDLCYD